MSALLAKLLSGITRRKSVVILISLVLLLVCAGCVWAEPSIPKITLGVGASKSPQDVSNSLQIVLLLTVLSLAPALVTMLTSFARIVIVLSFTRSALGAQQIPPNSVLIGLALFLTVFTMAPVWKQVNDQALKPYMAKQISYQQAIDRAAVPVRGFLFRQTRESDLALFVKLSKTPRPESRAEVPTYVLVPAFIISELKTAFTMGFLIFIPFLVIDLVVATTLMSMGMMMMPPMLISLPCKIMLFVLVDGWHLIVQNLITSFH
jgi:flagellar biosynthesis protein FliP